MPVVIIVFSISIGGHILSLASLSFLGFGLPPGSPDWGSLLSTEGRQYMEQAPWLALWPGLFLTIVVYSPSTCSAMPSGTCSTPGCGAVRAVTAPRR